jgi:II/X family phage/plasmid replication protein
MNRMMLVDLIRDANNITEGRAEAAFTTYRNIRADGMETVKGYMPKATYYRHLRYLRKAGITDSDLHNSNVFPIRPVRVALARPVASWEDMREAA